LIRHTASEPDEALERSSYVDTIMRETTSSHILETILSRSSDAVLAKLWSTYYLGRVAKLAGHPVANFTVARGIERLDATMLEATIAELAEAGSEAMRHLIGALSEPHRSAFLDTEGRGLSNRHHQGAARAMRCARRCRSRAVRGAPRRADAARL
jgi:hypothetical protein